jgi:hypothetical protein
MQFGGVSVINATKGVLFGFYIFRGERVKDDYTRLCKPSTCMAMQKKTWMTTFLFKEFLIFFNKSIPSGMSFSNQHLLFINGHGNHVTLEIIKQAEDFGLDMITLPSHTSHSLQPLDVFCFKPFKIAFRKVKNAAIFRNNHMEPNKITLTGWVN